MDGTADKIWETDWEFKTKTKTGTQKLKTSWKGFAAYIEEEYKRSEHNKNFAKIGEMMHEVDCQSCGGTRLKDKALSINLSGLNIAELSALSIDNTKVFFEQLLKKKDNPLLAFSYGDMKKDLESLIKLRLGHLSIDRRSSTLSGGEGQRLRLAQQLSGSLHGMTYVLDEPSIGLHQKDIASLLEIVDELKAKGNTIVIVEHDKEIIKKADYVIEMGPASGKDGGKVCVAGSFDEFMQSEDAITPPYLKEDVLPKRVDAKMQKDAFGFDGVNIFNLQNRDFSFSANGIIALTGVSGSGKSTLMHRVIYPSLTLNKAINAKSFYNNAGFDQVLEIDQKMISVSRLSSVFSHTGLMDDLAKIYADETTAKKLQLKKSAFVYTSKEGKCGYCNGMGERKISMDFMDDVWNVCAVCGGSRYSNVQEDVRIKGKSIADLQAFTLLELAGFVKDIPHKEAEKCVRKIDKLEAIGLGHLQLGQSTASLSGGEAQRLKMMIEMGKAKHKKILFLLDEPSSGLHYADLDKLIAVFYALVEEGHTVMFIEHNVYLIAVAGELVEMD